MFLFSSLYLVITLSLYSIDVCCILYGGWNSFYFLFFRFALRTVRVWSESVRAPVQYYCHIKMSILREKKKFDLKATINKQRDIQFCAIANEKKIANKFTEKEPVVSSFSVQTNGILTIKVLRVCVFLCVYFWNWHRRIQWRIFLHFLFSVALLLSHLILLEVEQFYEHLHQNKQFKCQSLIKLVYLWFA